MDIGSLGAWAAVGFALLRLVESILVVLKQDKALSVIKVIKEYFKLG